MKRTSVNGHPLPDKLVAMMATGAWERSRRTADLSVLPIEDKADLAFLSLQEMIRNTEELYAALARGDGTLFGLTAGGSRLPGLLDVRQAVVIAATYGQEALALDYAVAELPRVVATRYEPDGARWDQVTQDFDHLLELLGLSTG